MLSRYLIKGDGFHDFIFARRKYSRTSIVRTPLELHENIFETGVVRVNEY